VSVGLLALGTVVLGLGLGHLMPSLPNVVTLEAAALPLGGEGPMLGLRLALTALSWVAAAWAIFQLWPRVRGLLRTDSAGSGASPAAWRFLAASAVLLLAFSLVTGLYFDRYLLLPLPFLLPFFLPRALSGLGRIAVSVLLVALSLVFSIYFVDQRVRAASCDWDVGLELLRDTNDLHRIDAGVAFNGYHSYDWLSKKYGQQQDNPWPAWVNPEADLVVRGFELRDPRVQQISVRECRNRAGLRPYHAYLYRRTVFGGPPLATLQD
jgi:hypothetical protein